MSESHRKRKRAIAFQDEDVHQTDTSWNAIVKNITQDVYLQALQDELIQCVKKSFHDATQAQRKELLTSSFVESYLKEHQTEANQLRVSAYTYKRHEYHEGATRIIMDHDAFPASEASQKTFNAVLSVRERKKSRQKNISYKTWYTAVLGIHPWELNSAYTVIKCQQPEKMKAYHEKTCKEALSDVISFIDSGGHDIHHCCNNLPGDYFGSMTGITLTLPCLPQDESGSWVSANSERIIELIQKGYHMSDVLCVFLPRECIDIIQHYIYHHQPSSYRVRGPDYS
jgi:hypothetical protein